ncbi:MAG: S8 family serine peptidase [Nitrospirae bacterium]|nr:S8 family serine peptidase [Nitrospirota bacterium]
MTHAAAALALVAFLTAIGAGSTAEAATVDPLLLPILAGQRGADLLAPAVLGIAPTAPTETTVAVTLRFVGPPPDLQALGVTMGAVLGDVLTADVPLSKLSALAAHPAVLSIEVSRPLIPSLDFSVPISRASEVWTRVPPDGWSGHTGRGVLIGIIDTGLDLTHRDFRHPDGTTRVLAVWDQSSASGRPPFGFSFGAECLPDQIDARDCPEVDRVGHGTHVAGIAAGNGSATGRDQLAYRYIGMAPEADLLVVKLGAQTSNRVIEALAYLKNKSTALGRPLVVNLSLGTLRGAHDGTSDFERAIDAFTGPDGQPGEAVPARVVVVAGGNNGNDLTHASGSVGATLPLAIGFVVPPGAKRIDLDLWYPGNYLLGMSITTPSCGSIGPASPPSLVSETPVVTQPTSCGDVTITAGVDVNGANGDRETVAVLSSASELAAGTWYLTLGQELPPGSPAAFDIWSVTEDSPQPAAFTSAVDPSKTLAVPATATEAIAVVPFVTKTQWLSLLGVREYRGEVGGALVTTASRGPRRTCSFSTACPATQKPDLAAPGLGVTSSLSSRTDAGLYETSSNTIDAMTDPDRVHFILQGASMAAPHVAGAAALLLQINPTLTARDVKARLTATAQPQVGSADLWGAGKLDAKAAADAVVDPIPATPQGLTVVSVGSGRVALRWTPNPDLDLLGYRVYRRRETSVVEEQLIVAPLNAAEYEDRANLTNETPYVYTITAVDMVLQESSQSNEARAMPTAGEGSVGFCFIATAAYGTPWHPHVQSLRAFRDHHLLPSSFGRLFVAAYERVSPPLARVIARHSALRALTRAALTPVVLAVEQPGATAWFIALGALGLIILGIRRRPHGS